MAADADLAAALAASRASFERENKRMHEPPAAYPSLVVELVSLDGSRPCACRPCPGVAKLPCCCRDSPPVVASAGATATTAAAAAAAAGAGVGSAGASGATASRGAVVVRRLTLATGVVTPARADIRAPAVTTPPAPRSLCIRKTVGCMRTYSATCLLHVGVSDSRGRVWNFDQRGVMAAEVWPEAVCLPLDDSVMGGLSDAEFDALLADFVAVFKATGKPYQDLHHNCYDFAVAFLNMGGFRGASNHTKSSMERLLSQPLKDAITYVREVLELEAGAASVLEATVAARHPDALVWSQHEASARYLCDGCRKEIPVDDGGMWRCAVAGCDFDLCKVCLKTTT